MKILNLKVTGLPRFTEDVNINFMPVQKVSKEKNEMLTEISSVISKNNIMSFFGINASGKTSTLNVISFFMKMINNDFINNIKSNIILKDLEFGSHVASEVIFTVNKKMYKLITKISIEENIESNKKRFVILEEELFEKTLSSARSKINCLDFDDAIQIIKRSDEDLFLPDDMSIMIAFNKKNKTFIYCQDLIDWTDMNALRILGNFPLELIRFLDPSIEYIKVNSISENEHDIDIELKFKDKEVFTPKTFDDFNSYLSSGTVKGINIFIPALATLQHGGYLIIDEIENHFNFEIVSSLIRFFSDSTINQSGATIVFSTHYLELLDDIDRNDSIYFVKNEGGISVDNFSTFLKREDKKRSDFVKSGLIDSTMPTYQTYMNFKRAIPSYNMHRGNIK